VLRTVYRYGNMSAASNLVALDHGVRKGNLERVLDAEGKVLEVRETPDRIANGDTVLMPSIGGGYLMGCVGLRLACLGG
jgi:3-oxoacyl-[acyl-carrier-protein] synthase III